MRRFILFSCFLFLLSAGTQGVAASPPPTEPDPFALTQAPILSLTQKKNIRVVYDVKDDILGAGIGKGLYYVRGLIAVYKNLDISTESFKISVVLRGLLDHGVSVEVCNLTLRGEGWNSDDLLPGVTLVHDAYTRLIDLQQQGYAYIRF